MKKLWYKIKGFFLDIGNVIRWIPTIWKDRNWDYGFMLEMERMKLKQIINWYKKHDYGHYVDGKRDCRIMETALGCLDILLDSDWWHISEEHERLFDENGKYVPTPDECYVLDAYVNLGNYKRFMNWLPQDAIDNKPNFWRTDLREEKAWHLYHKIREQYMRSWWD